MLDGTYVRLKLIVPPDGAMLRLNGELRFHNVFRGARQCVFVGGESGRVSVRVAT